VVSYRLTSVESEARLLQDASLEHVRISNPITPEKNVLRRSVLASVLDDVQRNARLSDSLAFFEIGPAFDPVPGDLPIERRRLAIAMTGARTATSWEQQDPPPLDFFDLKGRIELLLSGLHYTGISIVPTDSVPYLHPGKAAEVKVGQQVVGVLGELHPHTAEKYDLADFPVLVADFDLEALHAIPPTYAIKPVPEFPPILEDIALIVDENVPAAQVEGLIRQTGGKAVSSVRLFDVYRGSQVGDGKKSLAYNLAYQAPDKTMTDAEAAAIRNKIVKRLEQEVGAKLRG
jgi:phenylalanyl-tRNA synthetase beta chain